MQAHNTNAYIYDTFICITFIHQARLAPSKINRRSLPLPKILFASARRTPLDGASTIERFSPPGWTLSPDHGRHRALVIYAALGRLCGDLSDPSIHPPMNRSACRFRWRGAFQSRRLFRMAPQDRPAPIRFVQSRDPLSRTTVRSAPGAARPVAPSAFRYAESWRKARSAMKPRRPAVHQGFQAIARRRET